MEEEVYLCRRKGGEMKEALEVQSMFKTRIDGKIGIHRRRE